MIELRRTSMLLKSKVPSGRTMPIEASSFTIHNLIKLDLSKFKVARAFSIASYSCLLIEKAVAVWSGLLSFFIAPIILAFTIKKQAFFLHIDRNITLLYSNLIAKGGVA